MLTKKLCAHYCVLFTDPFSTLSASTPLALSFENQHRDTSDGRGGRFWPLHLQWCLHLQGKWIKHEPNTHTHEFQCLWVQYMERWCKVNALQWHFWQASINTPSNHIYPPDTVDILSHTQTNHQLDLHNIRPFILSPTSFLSRWLPELTSNIQILN